LEKGRGQSGAGQPAPLTYLGQQRAAESLRFGIGMQRDGYNVFVLGPPGGHRHQLVEEIARAGAREKRVPDDWCYVNNFSNPERPRALRLPAGRGKQFREDMRALVEEIRLAIPAVFEEDDYRNQLKAIEADTQAEIEEQWRSIKEQAAGESIAVMQTPSGWVLAPMVDGEVIDETAFDKLPEKQRHELQGAIKRLSEELEKRIENLPKLRKKQHERIRRLDREVAAHTVTVLFADLRTRYADVADATTFLEEAQRDVIDNAQEFRDSSGPALPFLQRDSTALLGTYQVNLVVGNDPDSPAPVVYEPNPTYPNIIGKVEHRAEMGALLTDFSMVRGGALLQANGGFLVLDIHRVLGRPFVWEALKQALFTRQVRIESPADTLGFVGTTMLRPEPIPLDVKIILIGERWLYYLLSMYDNEFGGLFRVAADLDDDMERTPANVRCFAELITDRIGNHELLTFDEAAVRRVIEQRARQAGDSERLSTNIRSLDDLLLEADYRARERGATSVSIDDVIAAIRHRKQRLSRAQERIVDAIRRKTLLIDTAGECVGQVNGLSVVEFGDYRFGFPARITATTRVGTGDVVDIEREVKLGGAIHSKGVLILSSALSARYAKDMPLSLQGSIVFEQSYGGVDGDSASVAELCALMSSIANAPLRQNLACTGSINQLGRVQAVGGVNEKVEGFFDICRERGLDGDHGVIIPVDNVKHLMLREDVVDAVQRGEFAVYAVESIDDAIELLTGEKCETINQRIEDQLLEYAQLRRKFAEKADHAGG
jgi:lon-related putative ATP-dependent protease